MADERQSKPQLGPVNIAELPVLEPECGSADVYANVVNLNWTLYDVRIRFAELIQEPIDTENPTWGALTGVILERAQVTIPWHQAKLLQQMLADLVQKYEEANGELKAIKLPPA